MNMMLISLCTNSNILMVFLILKYTFSITCTIIPLIVIFNAIKPLFKTIITAETIQNQLMPIAKSIIAGFIVFILPTIFSFIFTELLENKDSTISNCFTNATIENVNRLKEKERIERKQELENSNKETAAEIKKRQEEEKKEREKIKKQREEIKKQGGTINGTGIWKDSLFPLPNGATRCRSSVFGSRTHPITGQYDYHSGDDYPAACGTSVYAVLDGQVVAAANDGGFHDGMGNYVKIQHKDGTSSVYMHSSNVLVRVGQNIRKGQEIMKVGTTGSSTGCHLHITIKNSSGTNVSPSSYIPTLPACS